MEKTMAKERIQTGLTENYLHNWTIHNALKEALQNMAYGVIKSGEPIDIRYNKEDETTTISDQYIGFPKSALYIGESEQRNDEDGLGTFGEGWKIFLLIMARDNIFHRVDTVGYSFHGKIEKTEHDTNVLIIEIEENDRTEGTEMVVGLSKTYVKHIMESFAVLAGIPHELTKKDGVIPGRKHELWIRGVKIENDVGDAPIDLMFSYNLKDRSIMNRDRSHVDTFDAMLDIRRIIYNQDYDFAKEYALKAIENEPQRDIIEGPYISSWLSHENDDVWHDVIFDLHDNGLPHFNKDILLIKSRSGFVNDKVKEEGYFLLDFPPSWEEPLTRLGYRSANSIVSSRITYDEKTADDEKYGSAPNKTVERFLKVFGKQFDYVPEIKMVNTMTRGGYAEIAAHYDDEKNIILINRNFLNKDEMNKSLLREMMKFYYGEEYDGEEQTNSDRYERFIINKILQLDVDLNDSETDVEVEIDEEDE